MQKVPAWTRPGKELLRRVIQRVACPDAQVGWAHFATREAFRIVEREGIDTILLNTPPYSSMRIAVALKRRYPKVKLVADIRDDWVGYYLPLFDSAATEHKWRIARRLERELIECADYVSAVTPSQSRQIRERYPEQPTEKFLYTPNGYDPDAFRGFQSRAHAQPGIVMTYFGSVYGNPVYSPKHYLDAVDSLRKTSARGLKPALSAVSPRKPPRFSRAARVVFVRSAICPRPRASGTWRNRIACC